MTSSQAHRMAHSLQDAEILLPECAGLPVIVRAREPRTPLDGWLERCWHAVAASFHAHGAMAFRDFLCPDRATFLEAIRNMGSQPFHIREESSRRIHLGDGIYTATEHPAQLDIFPHHESSYSLTVPARVFFFCADRDGSGGETLLADGCRIGQQVRPELRKELDERGWALVRRYGDGLGISWQQAYGTQSREEMEAYCTRNSTEVRWTGTTLFTRQVRRATLNHPVSGRAVWFNHICFFHHSALPADLLALLRAEKCELPFDTTYGDGRPIEIGAVEELRTAYRACSVSFEWHSQDVLVLDNLRIAHGRRAYSGRRRLLFAAADAVLSPDYS